MSRLRILAVTLTIATAVPSLAHAQERPFENSVFLGAKLGAHFFQTTSEPRDQALLYGVDAMITRQRYALLLSFDQASFTTSANNAPVIALSIPRATHVEVGEQNTTIRGVRRYTASLLAFPRLLQRGTLLPYLGLGATLLNGRAPRAETVFFSNYITAPDSFTFDAFANSQNARAYEQSVSTAAAVLMAGAQMQLSRVAVFGQASLIPLPSSSAFAGGGRISYQLEFGVRYNVGSAIDRDF